MTLSWQHPTIVAVALIVIAVIGWVVMDDGAATVKRVWFYDTNTCELFVGPAKAVPPIAAPSDSGHGAQSGVLATVIRVEGDDTPRIVYLQTYTPEGKQMREDFLRHNASTAANQGIASGTLVAKPPERAGDTITWYPLSSPAGVGVLMSVSTLAGGKEYSSDLPK
jgi:hypothetical protein